MFMKASAARGKRHSIMTDYVMRMLGLEVCSHRLIACLMHRTSKDVRSRDRSDLPCRSFTAVTLLQKHELAPERDVGRNVTPQHKQRFGEGRSAC